MNTCAWSWHTPSPLRERGRGRVLDIAGARLVAHAPNTASARAYARRSRRRSAPPRCSCASARSASFGRGQRRRARDRPAARAALRAARAFDVDVSTTPRTTISISRCGSSTVSRCVTLPCASTCSMRRPGRLMVHVSARWLASRRGVRRRLWALYFTGRRSGTRLVTNAQLHALHASAGASKKVRAMRAPRSRMPRLEIARRNAAAAGA